MNRKILLVEPNYKNKYPPMGLMKIATYYKMQGDQVTFFKGDLKELVLNDTYESLLEQLYANNGDVFWEKYKPQICNYLKKGSQTSFEEIPLTEENPIIKELLKYYRKYFYNKDYFLPENRKWDRIGITTLFTFFWDITIKTINFVKQLCKSEKDVMIGGVMASILPDRVKEATGIYPFVGTISMPGVLDNNDIIVDTLPLDYSILDEIDYEYPATNAYYAYMTRGCVNKCKFCAVPKLEPQYKGYIPISEQIRITAEHFGGKKDLLLLDNNVLASYQFNQIIDEIKQAGFTNDSKFLQPNVFDITIENLRSGYNDRGYLRNIVKQYRALIQKHGAEKIQKVYDLLEEHHLLEFHTAKKEAVFETYDAVKELFENHYKRRPKKRYVDFNQGIDARLITDENMEKLFEIPIRPVRIAFDSWKLAEIYTKAVKTAVRHEHRNLSNYLLYNFEDKPIELYQRLKLNVDLCEELDASIYSFPMKYHPIEDPNYFSNRDYIGKYWNRKFIRTIQAVLNSTKGKVGKGKSFFEKAFGATPEEFYKLLYMPEAMIIYRFYFEGIGLTDEWWNKFSALSDEKMEMIKPIIHKNEFNDIEKLSYDSEILDLLSYYAIKRDDAEKALKKR
ncbi:hypothetical protein [Marinisporobacter balticus]|uniref:Radical SAM superfamily enzyme YgiQ (UPF0313 family) n=1 Tax=Marinisporobacter balticus TaxID=2018667 RepID=A0A4R2K9S6_9FIRM|nr:hypothetical protein [Marinisporobacter balticus]TCO68737.1 hypothetical protein EV214_14116 [Marinisporobacter balticus]